MNRRVLAGVVALVVVIVGVWFLFLRGGPASDEGGNAEGKRTGKSSIATRSAPDSIRSGAMRWSLDHDPEGPLQLEGQVVGPDHKGVGGAVVWIGSVPPRSVQTEDDGSFKIDKLVPRSYTLTAESGELIGGPLTYKLTSTSDPAVIRLSEGATVVATIVDESRAPIVGARVRAYDMGDRTMTTDAKGEAMLRPVRPGYVAVQAVAEGYAPNTGFATVGTAGAKAALTLTLHKGFQVNGRVVDEAGKPIAKAKVMTAGGAWAADWSPDEAGEDDKRSEHDVVTNDKGEFTFQALASGTHTLTAVDEEHAPGHTTITVDGRALAGIEIVMKVGGVIAGRVVDKDKKPAPYVPVRVAGTGNQMWSLGRRQATSDKDGTFELRGLVRTKLQVRAEGEKAASSVVEVDLTTTGVKKDLELVLDVVGVIAGVVVDDTGAPVPEVSVNAFPDIMGGASMDALALADMSSATTDGAGKFAISGLPDGQYKLWPTRGSSGGGQAWGERGTSAKTGDTNVKLTLPAMGQLVGKLMIEGGNAPKLARIHVGYQAPVPIDNGSFTVKELTPGKYHVVFRGPEFAELQQSNVEILPGKTTDLGTIKVTKGRRLTGKVIDSKGAPVANAKIKLAEMLFSSSAASDQAENWEEIAGVRATVTDQTGEFALIGVPMKDTNVIAEGADGRSLAVPVPGGTEDPPPVTLQLRGFGSIKGTVTLKGKPQPGITVSVSSKGGGVAAMFTESDDAGVFTLAKVPEGTQVLAVMQTKMMAFKSHSTEVVVVAGQETKVEIEIPVGTITLAVTVKGIGGVKIDAAQVFLFRGVVTAATAKQLTDSFMAGAAQGMKIWLGGAFPPPEFDEMTAGDYSVCTVPIAGNLGDPAFQQQLQAAASTLKVYCRQVKIAPTPNEQKITHEVPVMEPLQPPKKPTTI